MTSPDASLSRLLVLVEQWQAVLLVSEIAHPLGTIDITALRAAAQQHAEALRTLADHYGTVQSRADDEVRAAADFLSPKEEA